MDACFALVLHRKDKKRIKIAFSTCVRAVFWRSVLLSTPLLGLTAYLCVRSAFSWQSVFTQLTNTCLYLRHNAVHLQHTLIQDADLMVLDVDSPQGAVIGSTTWHKNITFPSHPSLSCRQLTPVSGTTKAGAFIFPVSAHPPLSTEPPCFHKLKVE